MSETSDSNQGERIFKAQTNIFTATLPLQIRILQNNRGGRMDFEDTKLEKLTEFDYIHDL